MSADHTPSNFTTGATAQAEPVHFASRPRTYFDILIAVFCVVIILSNIGASKGVVFGPIGDFPIITDGGFFLFPLAYVLGDIFSEVYGFRAARRVIFTGFALSILASLSFWVIIALPGFDDPDSMARNEAFAMVLGPVWQIVAASLLGYVVGQTLNSYVLVKIKERMGERALWVRLLGSTGVGEAVDTFIFCLIAAPVIGIQDVGQFFNYFILGYLYKCAVEVVVMPLTYQAIRWLKRREPSYWSEPVARG